MVIWDTFITTYKVLTANWRCGRSSDNVVRGRDNHVRNYSTQDHNHPILTAHTVSTPWFGRMAGDCASRAWKRVMQLMRRIAKCGTLAIEVNFFVYGRRKYKGWAMAQCGRMDAAPCQVVLPTPSDWREDVVLWLVSWLSQFYLRYSI